MKKAPLILAMFILYLGITPCTDAMTCSSHVDGTHHSHEDDEEDTCSPFCACHCCGMAIDKVDLRPLLFNVKKHKFLYKFNYTFNYAFEYVLSTWHPPAI